jgi:hypothetical protein
MMGACAFQGWGAKVARRCLKGDAMNIEKKYPRILKVAGHECWKDSARISGASWLTNIANSIFASVACCAAIQVLVPTTEMRAKLIEGLKMKTALFQ